MGSWLWNVLLFLAAIASIVAVVREVFKSRNWRLASELVLMVALSVLAASSYFAYRNMIDKDNQIAREKANVRSEAARLLKSLPKPVFDNPGRNKGIVMAGLMFLELHKELYPDTYQPSSQMFRDDLKFANEHPASGPEGTRMEASAHAMVQTIAALAGETVQIQEEKGAPSSKR